MSGLRLDERFHHVEGFGLAPVGGLLGDQFQVGEVGDHVIVALRTDMGVGVGFTTEQFHVLAFFAHQFDELFGTEDRALVVVGDQLRGGNTCLH